MKEIMAILMLLVLLMSSVPAVFGEETQMGDDSTTEMEDSSDTDIGDNYPGSEDSPRVIRLGRNGKPILNKMINTAIRKIESQPELKERYEGLTEEEKEKLIALPRAIFETYANAGNLRERLGDLVVKYVTPTEFVRKRIVTAEKIEAAKIRYMTAKQGYLDAKERYLENKEIFMQKKDEIKEKCAGEDSKECEDLREDALEHAKQVLLNALDKLQHYFEQLKERIESNDNLEADEAEEMVQRIEADLEDVEELRGIVEAATTKEDLKEASGKIKELWQDVKKSIRYRHAKLYDAVMRGIYARLRIIEARGEKAIELLQDQGISTDEIEAKLEEYSAKLTEAKDYYQEGGDLLNEAKESQDEELVNQAKEKFREAHDAAKEAYSLLREIIRLIREAGGNLPEVEELAVAEEVGDSLDTAE